MIETSDIYRAINDVLELEFPDIPIQDKDKKTSNPPFLYLQYIRGVTTQTAMEYENTNFFFNIVYFSDAQSVEELIKIEKKLKAIFKKPFKISFLDNSRIQYQEVESITTTIDEDNYSLNCSLNISIDQLISEEEGATDFIDRYNEFDNEEFIEELEI